MFFKDKRVLVTGGAGFVGGYFIDHLLSQGAYVRTTSHVRPVTIQHERLQVVPADLMQQNDCLRVCENIDYVVHAAGAVSAAGVTTKQNPMNAITVNLTQTAQMIEAAWSCNVQRLLVYSSSTGYPALNHPVKEEEFWAGPTHSSYFGYGWMRRYIERLAEFAHQRSNTKLAIVRPTAIYGERDDFDPHTSHVIPALIRRAVNKENPFIVWGSKDVVRDFLHVSDLVAGSLLVLEKKADCDPVNIGYGSAVTIGDIVGHVLQATGHTQAQVRYDESKPTTIPFRMADISKARNLLGFSPKVSLEDGLKRTVDWYTRSINPTNQQGPKS